MPLLLYIVSIIAGLLSFSAYNIGFALEKKAVDILPDEQKDNILQLYIQLLKNKQWLFGLLLTVLSVPLYFIALFWAPFTTIAPLSGFGIIVLVLYAHSNVKERFSKIELLAIFSIIIGITISSYFTSKTEVIVDYSSWQSNLFSTSGIILISIMLSFAVLSIILTLLTEFRYNMVFLSIFAGIASGMQTLLIKGLTTLFSTLNEEKWANLSIYLGGLLAYILFVLLSALCSTGGLQIAFRDGKVSTSMSIYNGIMTIIPIFYGSIVLKEWTLFSAGTKIILIIAICVLTAGIVVLSLSHKNHLSPPPSIS